MTFTASLSHRLDKQAQPATRPPWPDTVWSSCEQVNSVYIAQLQAVLTWRQSIGIVGGRPSSSLYFIGYQHEHVLYLDPHEVQPVSEAAAKNA